MSAVTTKFSYFFKFTALLLLLDNSQLYTVPTNQIWTVTQVKRNDCNVCTSDVYVQNGNALINGVWVSGTFDFSIDKKTEVTFGSSSTFALGDVIQYVEVSVKEKP
ncbi:hypothetical protein [Vibrio sinaloensis]|uniref:hypothetical protein n=1 Tax=Photobacterium sp. (strain ATCC 43367) TaxID=379097 RepID=UPI002048656C|nr:hypothetical protein [Vibrio sinaloensis]UPQ89573.1 hypothetical protein MTO69_17640 [Vibrio sinaloensis]